jgi:hypothetical protein
MDDISRGGWVVAIGLSEVWPIASDMVEYVLIAGMPHSPVINSLQRIHHCLQNMVKGFPDDEIIRKAEKLMRDCVKFTYCSSGSELFSFFDNSSLSKRFDMAGTGSKSRRWFEDWKETARHASALTAEECVWMM